MVRVSFVDGWSVESSGEPPVEVTLAHDAMIHEQRSATTAHGSHSGWYPGGRYVYRRSWQVPTDLAGRRATLVFEGAYHRSRVRVDGADVGGCLSGYTEFEALQPWQASAQPTRHRCFPTPAGSLAPGTAEHSPSSARRRTADW